MNMLSIFFSQEPILYYGSPDTPQDKIDYLKIGYQLLNDTIVDDYIVGNQLTLADLSCITSIASYHAFFPCLFDSAQFPKLAAWVERMKKLPYYKEINQDGAEEFATVCQDKLAQNRAAKK